MEVVALNQGLESKWDDYVKQHSQGTVFHTTVWKRVIERAFGYRAYYLAAVGGDSISGVLPLFLTSNPLTGRTMISTPFAVYGGICADNEEARQRLKKAACDLATEQQVQYLELRVQDAQTEDGFLTKNLYVTFDTGLDSDPDRALKKLPRDTRYMIRKAQKLGLTVTQGADQLSTFYEIYARSVHNLGTPVFSREFFRILIEEFGDAAEIMVVWKDQLALAAVMSFRFRDWILPYYGGSTLEGRQFAANNFMYWELMQSAIQRGIRYFDFGRSKLGTGAYAFKSQWGMRERTLPYQVLLVKRKTMPNFSPANPTFNRVIQLWKHIPFPLTKAIGPSLVRLFP